MKIVWHHPGVRQKAWIRFLFGDLVTGEIEDPDFACFEDDTIHVVSMIFKPLREMEPYFQECRKLCRNIVLYHAGDEWFSGGCGSYRYFDNVIREMPSFFTRADGIMVVALGDPNLTPISSAPPASRRPFLWSFAGEVRNTRLEMVKCFNHLPRGRLVDSAVVPPLALGEYQALLRESTFAPCGMGNVVTESWRVYEAIEHGAIPIVERRLTLDYYTNLLGKHPIPTFRNWKLAAGYVADLMHRDEEMDALQREITSWWQAYKRELTDRIGTMLLRSHNHALRQFADRSVNRNMLVHEFLRVMELLRHQSAMNIRRRFANPVSPVRRIILGLAGRDER